jgi:hypothetical protein
MNSKESCPERSGSTGAEVGVLILLSDIGAVSTRVATGPRLLPRVTTKTQTVKGNNGVKTVFIKRKHCILRFRMWGEDMACDLAIG